MKNKDSKQKISGGFKSTRRDLIITEVLTVILGILMTFFPKDSGTIICYAIGVGLCLIGLIRLVTYISGDKKQVLGSFDLVQGVAMAGFGVFFIIKPGVLASFLIFGLSIVMIVCGILKIQFAVDMSKLKFSLWWIELIAALAMVILGIVAFVNPFDAVVTLMIFIGICLMVSGIWDLISLFWLSKILKKVKENIVSDYEVINLGADEYNDDFDNKN